MKKESFFALRIFPLIFMFIITAVCITLVTGLYLTTKERVVANETLFLKQAVLYAAGISYPEDDFIRTQEIYSERIEEKNGYYEASLEGGETGYIVPFTGPGLWGPIETMVGFRQNLKTLLGLAVVSQNETPGLGARINEEWFKEQFRGKTPPLNFVEEGTADEAGEVDAITGATRTSMAMKAILQNVMAEAPKIVKGEE